MNIVTLTGRLGRDMKLEQGASGPYSYGALGVNMDYIDKKTGEKVKKTVWVDFCLTGKIAENTVRLVGKTGNRLMLQGELDNKKKEGEKYAQLSFRAVRVEYIDYNDTTKTAATTAEPEEEHPF
jgi:single-stranded DNA-binding protein